MLSAHPARSTPTSSGLVPQRLTGRRGPAIGVSGGGEAPPLGAVQTGAAGKRERGLRRAARAGRGRARGAGAEGRGSAGPRCSARAAALTGC